MKNILIIIIHFTIVFNVVKCQTDYSELKSFNQSNYNLTESDKKFLDTLQYYSFKYFIEEINHENGLVKDRSTETSPSSIAAVGFAYPVWAIGAEKGWISRQKAAELTFNSLNFFYNSEQSTNKFATGYKGFYYHFLDMKTGKRFWNCELSSIDSGLLFAGMIFARNYFNQQNEIENKIRDLATKLLERADWNFWQRKSNDSNNLLINMGWKENGFEPLAWFGYTESLFLYVIAAGYNYKNVEKAFENFHSTFKWREPYKKEYGHVVFPPLFGHQYSFVWLNPNGLIDSYLKKRGIDYYENSRRATYVNREYSIVNPLKWKGYDSLTWGLTACDGPGDSYNFGNKKFYGYAARGTAGLDSTEFDDGTIAPTAAGASIVFAPEICVPALINIKNKYPLVWNKYGLLDSFNPTLNWVNKDYIAIDQGPIILMIENFYNGFVWKYFMKDEVIQKGLKRLGINYQLTKGN
ncbi:MAG: hypothetical protein N2321_11785 [Melioribacteraceae bacterium]|nr:hypothetical protein [Melioribacteraceae bacterium]